ncbi:MAG: chromosome segregation protein SMC [Planctomycetes bacterium]|nr:chromosome segregation protein SMC [Planctomycetota bacterium]
MFEEIRLRNYRTHRDTRVKLGAITLLIGNNNSGKSNLLAGIRHFSKLVWRARPVSEQDRQDREQVATDETEEQCTDPARLRPGDLFSHKYRLATKEDPIGFDCRWRYGTGTVEYFIELYEHPRIEGAPACRERIRVQCGQNSSWSEVHVGWDTVLGALELRAKVAESRQLSDEERQVCSRFFADMSHAFVYHLQPSFLKGQARTSRPTVGTALVPMESHGPTETQERLHIPSQLGYEGANLQETLLRTAELDERTFQRFIAALRRFDTSFHGIRRDPKRGQPVWEFDLGHDVPGRLDEFQPFFVSDGLMKAAAVALLTALYRPPALILIEEIENGVNPGNIHEFMGWLWQAAGPLREEGRGYATQFVLTSHSPSVLREFADRLDQVYTMRLDRHGFKSDVRNLAESLDVLIGIGAVDGEIQEQDGRRIVKLPRQALAELWYSGTIG